MVVPVYEKSRTVEQNRTEQNMAAWTLGVCACRRNSQVTLAVPWSGANPSHEQQVSTGVLHPLCWMACKSSFGCNAGAYP